MLCHISNKIFSIFPLSINEIKIVFPPFRQRITSNRQPPSNPLFLKIILILIYPFPRLHHKIHWIRIVNWMSIDYFGSKIFIALNILLINRLFSRIYPRIILTPRISLIYHWICLEPTLVSTI